MRSASWASPAPSSPRSEEHTSELQSPCNLVCRLLLEKKKGDPVCRRVPQRDYDFETGKKSADVLTALSRAGQLRRPAILMSGWLWDQRFFFFNDAASTEIYTLSLHDALPI